MYSNKFAAKLVNIRQLCKKNMDNLNIFIVLSTYYLTFRIVAEYGQQDGGINLIAILQP